jgi:hypothetical protein
MKRKVRFGALFCLHPSRIGVVSKCKEQKEHQMFTVLEKDLSTETIITAVTFSRLADAIDWVEEMSSIWIDERAYKIVES